MKKSRALALLLAAGLSASTVSQLPVAIAQEAPAQTMAEIYQPYYEDVDERTDSYVLINPEGMYPRGTKFSLRNPTYGSDYFYHGPLGGTIWGHTGQIHLSQPGGELPNYGNGGYTTTIGVVVSYPDGSSEYISATAKMTSSYAALTNDPYSTTWIGSGDMKTIAPVFTGKPALSYSFVLSEELDSYREQGWEFFIDRSVGNITAVAPEGDGQIILPVSMTFEDGSNTITHAILRSGYEPEPGPEPTPEPQPGPEPAPKRGGSSFGSSS